MLQSQTVVAPHIVADAIALPNKVAAEHTIKVAATSKTTAVAGAIAGIIRQNHFAEVQAIGAAAVNQAIKAVAVAIGYLKDDDIHVICIPYFAQIMINDEECTAIRFRVEPRQ
jgi:stage V sporulation protein S